jgi:putative glutamine amidotransferase
MSRPLIGITCGSNETKYELTKLYAEQVLKAGGDPVILCPGFSGIERLDGLLLSGGDDVSPKLAGTPDSPLIMGIDPLRDELEISMCKGAQMLHKKVLGICRGIQMLNCAMGGTLYYDIEECLHPAEEHRYKGEVIYHELEVKKETLLYLIVGGRIRVNSYHHQAVRNVAPGFSVSTVSPGGVIEAIENREMNMLGVQWHPERIEMTELFLWLTNG